MHLCECGQEQHSAYSRYNAWKNVLEGVGVLGGYCYCLGEFVVAFVDPVPWWVVEEAVREVEQTVLY